MLKRTASVLLMLFLLNLISGCWNRVEPEKYAWLTWVGLDLTSDGKIAATVVVTPPLSPVPTGAAPPEKLMLVSSATGDTLFEAVRNINNHIPYRLFWPYLQAVILGENLARTGVEQQIDVLLRNIRTRKNAWVFVTKGPASSVFKINPQFEKNPAVLAQALVKTEQGFLGTSRVIRMKDFQSESSGWGVDPVVAVLGVWDNAKGKVVPPGAKVPPKGELVLDGSAVFRGDKLIGWLSPEESQTFLLAKGEMKTGLITVPHPDNQLNLAGVEIIKNSATLKAKLSGGQAAASINIKLKANLGDQRFNVPGKKAEDAEEDPEFYVRLGEKLSEKIKSDVEKLVEKSQTEFGADIFGIGDYIMNRYPNDWDQVQAHWLDYYKRAAVTVEVKVDVLSPNTMRSHPSSENIQ